MSTILKILVGVLSFIISALLVKTEFINPKSDSKINYKKLYIGILVIIMISSSIYTIMDGYDVINSANKLEILNKELQNAKTKRDSLLHIAISSNIEIKDLSNKLNPFLKLAMEKNPETDTASALAKLYEEIERIKTDVRKSSSQTEFKPINSEVKNKIINKLKDSLILRNIDFLINDWTGKLVNKMVSKEINDIIIESGLSSRVKNVMGQQGGYIPPPIEINVDPINIQAFDEFVIAFEPLFYNYKPGLRAKKGMANTIRVRIFGTPTFKLDGRIKY